jgi:hypothetical protein
VEILFTYEFVPLQGDLVVGGILDDLGDLEEISTLKPLTTKVWLPEFNKLSRSDLVAISKAATL